MFGRNFPFGNLASLILLTYMSLIADAQTVDYPATVPIPYGSTTPCSGPATGTINVPDTFTVSDLNVRFVASHTWRTDTNLTITSPSGTSVDLLIGPYAGNFDNYNIIFDDEASVVVDTGSHAANQSTTGAGVEVLSESDSLSDFDGEPANGNWAYSICDVYPAADNGSVITLDLQFEAFPDVQVTKDVSMQTIGDYAIPGSDVIYTFTATNGGLGSVDADTIVLIDTLPTDVTFYNGDIDDGGPETDPVAFVDALSGLTFTYPGDVGYSNLATRPANMSECTYTPVTGYDPLVQHICLNPKGAFAAGTPDPSFSLSFRVRIK